MAARLKNHSSRPRPFPPLDDPLWQAMEAAEAAHRLALAEVARARLALDRAHAAAIRADLSLGAARRRWPRQGLEEEPAAPPPMTMVVPGVPF